MQTETELIEQAKSGNGKAFELLIRPHKRNLHFIVFGFFKSTEESKDVLADIIAKVYCNLHKYRPDYKFSTWSNNLAKNYCIDEYRKKKFKVKIVDVAYEGLEYSDRTTVQDEIIKNEEYTQVHFLLNRLPKKFYKPVYLHFFENKKYREIALELDMALGTVHTYIWHGMKALRKIYAQNVN